MDAKTTFAEPKNLICNFRAPTVEKFNRWKTYVQWTKSNGLDVCNVTLSLVDAFMTGMEGTQQIKSSQQVVNLQMNNQFLYQVSKPKQEPFTLNCVKQEFRRTFGSIVFEAYVLEKARDLNREFSFRDFIELKHDAFRRIVLRLKRKGKIIANPQRTIPRFYILSERLTISEENLRTTL